MDGLHPPQDAFARGLRDRGKFGVDDSNGIKGNQGEPIVSL